VRFFESVYQPRRAGAVYDPATVQTLMKALTQAATRGKQAVQTEMRALSQHYAPAENAVSAFFRQHPAITPKGLVSDTLIQTNKAGEGGSSCFYPIRHPDLTGYGLLAPRPHHGIVADYYRHKGYLQDDNTFEPIQSPLARLSGATSDSVGFVAGRIGRVLVVKTVPGDPLGSYFDPNLSDPAAQSMLFRGHCLGDLSPEERADTLAALYSGDKAARRLCALEDTPNREAVRTFEQRYVRQLDRIAHCAPAAFDAALETISQVLQRGYRLDWAHNLNTMLSGEGDLARFGFIDLQDPQYPRQPSATVLSATDIGHFANILVGAGTDFYGSHWLVTDPACAATMKQSLPQILEKLRGAAQRRGIGWNPGPLQEKLCRQSALPDLNTAFAAPALPQPL
jgi:hypothetical protein